MFSSRREDYTSGHTRPQVNINFVNKEVHPKSLHPVYNVANDSNHHMQSTGHPLSDWLQSYHHFYRPKSPQWPKLLLTLIVRWSLTVISLLMQSTAWVFSVCGSNRPETYLCKRLVLPESALPTRMSFKITSLLVSFQAESPPVAILL